MAHALLVGPPLVTGRAVLLDWLREASTDERPWLSFHQGAAPLVRAGLGR